MQKGTRSKRCNKRRMPKTMRKPGEAGLERDARKAKEAEEKKEQQEREEKEKEAKKKGTKMDEVKDWIDDDDMYSEANHHDDTVRINQE